MPRAFEEVERVGLFTMRDDGVLDNVGDRLKSGWAVYDFDRTLNRRDAIRPGDTFYVSTVGRYWGGAFATFTLNQGEAFALAQERYVSYIIEVSSGANINVPNFHYPEDIVDEDDEDDEYDSDECNDPLCECHYDGSEDDDDDSGVW